MFKTFCRFSCIIVKKAYRVPLIGKATKKKVYFVWYFLKL